MAHPNITISKLCLNVNLGNKTLNQYLNRLAIGGFVDISTQDNRKTIKATIRTREMLFVLDKLPDDEELEKVLN